MDLNRVNKESKFEPTLDKIWRETFHLAMFSSVT